MGTRGHCNWHRPAPCRGCWRLPIPFYIAAHKKRTPSRKGLAAPVAQSGYFAEFIRDGSGVLTFYLAPIIALYVHARHQARTQAGLSQAETIEPPPAPQWSQPLLRAAPQALR